MTDWRAYEQRLISRGETQRERVLSAAARGIQMQENKHPSCKVFRKNTIDVKLLVRSTANGYVQNFIVLPEQRVSVNIGDILSYKNKFFIVTERYFDDDLMARGSIEECNHLFRFQNFNSRIIETRGIVVNPYSRSSVAGKFVEEPFNQLKFVMPLNSDTRKIYIGKRFIIEVGYNADGKAQPFVYKVVMVGSETDNYDDGGLLTLSAEYDVAQENDNIEQMVANYIEPSDDEIQSPVANTCVIGGESTIVLSFGERKYSPVFYDADGNINQNIVPIWNIDLGGLDPDVASYRYEGNDLYINVQGWVDNIGKVIHIQLVDSNGAYSPTSLDVKVVAPY